MESLRHLVDRAMSTTEHAMSAVDRAMSTLEQASGPQFVAFFSAAVAVLVVLGLLASRWLLRAPARMPSVRKEPALQQLTTDRATLDPENPALTGYSQILEASGIAVTEQHALIREYAGQLEDIRERLTEIAGGFSVAGEADQAQADRLAEVRTALASGAVDQAAAVLGAIGASESGAGRTLRQQAEQRLMGATLAQLVAGDLQMATQNTALAAEHYRAAIESVPPGNEALLAECLNKHGTSLYRGRNPDAAAISFKRAAKLVERIKGPNDPDLATALNNLAMLYYVQGEYSAAEPLYKRALDIDQYALGPEATAVSTDLNNLALLYKKQGRLEEAEPLMKRALAIKTKHFDPGHPSLITGLRNYAGLLRTLGREEEAETFEVRADALPPKRRPDDADT